MLNQAVALLPKRPTRSASTGGSSRAWPQVRDDYIYLSIPLVTMIKDADTALCFCKIRKIAVSFRSVSAQSGGEIRVERAELAVRLAFPP
jgi:hypothetical protein